MPTSKKPKNFNSKLNRENWGGRDHDHRSHHQVHKYPETLNQFYNKFTFTAYKYCIERRQNGNFCVSFCPFSHNNTINVELDLVFLHVALSKKVNNLCIHILYFVCPRFFVSLRCVLYHN